MRLLFVSSAVLAVVALSGCGPHSAAKDEVRSLLNDPDSAKFSALSNGVKKGDVCGVVNAKNRMGGYVGNTPFYYEQILPRAVIVKPPEEGDFRSLWLAMRSGNSRDEYVSLAMQCRAAKRWDEVCGSAYPAHIDSMCEEFAEGRNMYTFLDKKYGK